MSQRLRIACEGSLISLMRGDEVILRAWRRKAKTRRIAFVKPGQVCLYTPKWALRLK